MRKLDFFIFVLIAVLLEATLLHYFKIFNVRPELVLSLVVLATFYLEQGQALCLAVFAGILKDTLNIQAFGIDTILFPLWSFAIIKLSKKISLDNNPIRAALIFIVVMVHCISANLILFSLNRSVVSWGGFLRITFLECVYTTAVFPLVFKIIKPALPKIEI